MQFDSALRGEKLINKTYNMKEIIINYYENADFFNQIVFINDDIIEDVEPFELKYHSKYLNLPYTRFEEIKN